MTENWIGGDNTGNTVSGGSKNNQPRGSFDRAYFGAKQEITNYGLKIMAGDFNDQNSNSSNSLSSFNGASGYGNVPSGAGSDPSKSGGFTFEPVGLSGDGANGNGSDGANGGNGGNGGNRSSDGRSDYYHNSDVFYTDDDENDAGEGGNGPDDGFDVEEENSFTFFGDDVNIGDVDLEAFDEDGDEDVKVYRRGEYAAFEGRQAPQQDVRGAQQGTPNRSGSSNANGDDFDNEFFESVYSDRGKGLRTALIVLVIVVVFGLAVFLVYQYAKGGSSGNKDKNPDVIEKNDVVLDGVCFNGESLAGMTREEVEQHIIDTYITPVQQTKISLKIGDSVQEHALSEFFALPSAANIAKEIYEYGRNSASEKESLSTREHNVVFTFRYDQSAVQSIIDRLGSQTSGDAVNPTYQIRDGFVVFTTGRKGGSINTEGLRNDLIRELSNIESKLNNMRFSQGINNVTIEAKGNIVDFTKLDLQEIIDKVYKAPVNAEYVREGNDLHGKITVKPDEPGIVLDAVAASRIVDSINNGEADGNQLLEFANVSAEITADMLREDLYYRCLGAVESVNSEDRFSTNDGKGVEERAHNIKRAVTLIGTVELFPGEQLNLIEMTGRLNSGNSFWKAVENVNDAGGVVSGGGISQFATALYECALRSGLNVNRAWNNEYYPNYGFPGFDAYISSSEDSSGLFCNLIIENSFEGPIRIATSYDDATNTLKVTIDGPKSTDPSAITLRSDLVKSSINTDKTGTLYWYNTYRVRGGRDEYLGQVVYLKLGEGVEPDPTPTPEETPTPTPEETPTPTAEDSPTPTAEGESPTPTATPEGGESPTPTPTPEGESPTPTPTPTPEGESPTPTPTPTPEGESPTPSPTPDGESPTPSPTPDGESPTPSPTPDGESPSPTPTPTPETE